MGPGASSVLLRRGHLIPPLAAGGLFLIVAALLGPGVVWGDTVQYIRIAHELGGMPVHQAWFTAYTEYCAHPSSGLQGTGADCASAAWAGAGPIVGVHDRTPAYAAIFSPRIGYPLVSLPLMTLLGDQVGLWIVAVLSTALAGLLVHRIARVVGLGRRTALLSQLAFYLLPVGLDHGTALLAEGPSLMAALILVLGVAHLLRGSRRRGLLLAVAGYALVYFFKYSSVLILCVAVLAVCVVMVIVPSSRHDRRVRLTGVVALALTLASFVIGSAFGLPGVEHSLQDTFTWHFTLPPVPDPWVKLLFLEGNFLGTFVGNLPLNPGWVLVAAIGIAGIVLLLRRRRPDPSAWALTVPAGLGVLTVVGHPVYSQSARLGSPVWVTMAFGVGIAISWAVDRFASRRRRSRRAPVSPLAADHDLLGAHRPTRARRDAAPAPERAAPGPDAVSSA
ncbi:hypothetical protein GCM10011512_02440 [Tersicoccus solisilvae]|uniref:Glycosyltransferase RgtA/B/C/D-like domain-containing protein n=1 Tax=Tersicoccus solisilvae TaxID=1882339 RepID=A0ABQ1NKV6_9MICC|nr:hypothetical protein [Tersicoccus solisilvae]GGC79312.1 hypothetical protein GCM10011512_02440 [Tersicoccus solisilvae]